MIPQADLELLEQAKESGEVLKVRYMGGSDPGSVRLISPVNFKGAHLWARCMASGRVKQFCLDKLELCSQDEDVSLVSQDEIIPRLATFSGAADFMVEDLESAGWLVSIEDQELSLYRRFKNGKRRKHPDACFFYWDEVVVVEYAPDGDYEVFVKPADRPWVVECDGYRTVRFKNLGKAAVRFRDRALDMAKKLM